MRKCLFIVNEYPFPPRNGVTIPTSNYCRLLHESFGFEIDIILLKEKKENIDMHPDYNVEHLLISRNKIKAIFNELFFVRPYFNSYTFDKQKLELLVSTNGPYDLILSSPINATRPITDILSYHETIFDRKPKSIAAISDSYALVLSGFTGKKKNDNIFNINYYLRKLRSYLMRYHETKILKKFDRIFVQTKRDYLELCNNSGFNLEKKIQIVRNGVDQNLFKIHNDFNKNFIYVGNLSSEYTKDLIQWFYDNVWKEICQKDQDIRWHLYSGQSLKTNELHELRLDPTITIYDRYIDNIVEIYRDKAICLAPIFKENGFMNKVAESLSAGILVIGDQTAFNGMIGIEHGVNALIANSAEEFISAIISVLESENKWGSISKNAKEYSLKEFSWNENVFEELVQKQ